MSRPPDSGQLDLAEVFSRFQREMLAQLSIGGLFEHPSAAGDAFEKRWLALFRRYLPKRYRAAPAFIIDSTGRRSRQIDLAVFDNLYSPLLFPHESGLHVAAESVYAIFEIKAILSRQHIADAAEKAASVRDLKRTSVDLIIGGAKRPPAPPHQILAGILATTSVWTPETYEENLRSALQAIKPSERLNLGCALQHGAFEYTNRTTHFSTPEQSLLFFILRLIDRLRSCGTAPAADYRAYLRSTRP